MAAVVVVVVVVVAVVVDVLLWWSLSCSGYCVWVVAMWLLWYCGCCWG